MVQIRNEWCRLWWQAASRWRSAAVPMHLRRRTPFLPQPLRAGSGAVSGYTVTNLHYALDATTPANIDSLTFTISPAVPSTGTGKVIISAALSTGGPTNYTCTTDTRWNKCHVRDDPSDTTHGSTVDRRDGRRSSVAATR